MPRKGRIIFYGGITKMGIFKVKLNKESVGKKTLSMIKKLFGKEISFQDISFAITMEDLPTEEELEIITKRLRSIGINTDEIKCQWIKLD